MTFRGVLLACSFLATSAAQADNKLDEAKAHVQTGAQLYDENNFRGALVEFQRAYELAPSYKILFNIAQVHMELMDYAGALNAYVRYLREGGPDVPADRRSEVTIEIERLKGRVGSITIQTVAGAEVLIDDVSLGYAPLPEPVAVNAGRHKVTVQSAGKDPITRMFDVAGRQEITAALGNDVAPVIGTPVVPLDPTKIEPVGNPSLAEVREPKSMTPVIVAWSLTGVLGITAGVFMFKARSEANTLADLRATYPVNRDDLVDQQAKTNRNARIGDGFLAAAVVGVGLTTYLTLSRRSWNAEVEKEKSVSLQIGPTGVAIAGQF